MKNPIEKFRVSQDITRPEFARLAGLSYRALQAVELGYSRKPKDATVTAVAKMGYPGGVNQIRKDLEEWFQTIAR